MPEKKNITESKDSAINEKKFNKKHIFAIICTLVAVLFVSLFTPLYSISKIMVEGNSAIASDVLIRASGIEYGDSFFEVSIRESTEKLSKVAYVDTVKVKRVFPDKIKIVVKESSESVYLSFAGNYIGIDYRGKILDVKQQMADVQKPVVYGVNIHNFTIGSFADIEYEDKKHLLFELISAIDEENLGDSIYNIDITDIENIFLVLRNNITVKYGDYNSIRYKTAYLKTVLPEIVEETGGVLDISDTEKVKYTN